MLLPCASDTVPVSQDYSERVTACPASDFAGLPQLGIPSSQHLVGLQNVSTPTVL